MSLNITVLISGSGTNLQALIDAQKTGQLNGKITQVISSSDSAYGLKRAEEAGIPTKTHILKNYYKGTTKDQVEERKQRREQFNLDLSKLLINGAIDDATSESYVKPDLIVCAGWMLILSPTVLQPLEEAGITIINLHPALPGAFDGTHAIDRCWKAGQDGEITKGGVMIHRVIAEVDRGAPILVKELDLIKGESLEEYEDRVHKVEHVAIVEGTNITLEQLSK
ncbi:Phosphoribosylglycinamide formyltransferase [Candida viswanathii]|jgi:phosphoribosylglycinamide formyltransferase|uniref:Phosphoribosylglycinamide formyltransferase n=1 Tax=Candida viswanathii TaxID=5486 RepID=A0A367XMJ3_9ASCO|nr:Phosphoribosylglycinamide formyltransferase [Candida viswanathii]